MVVVVVSDSPCFTSLLECAVSLCQLYMLLAIVLCLFVVCDQSARTWSYSHINSHCKHELASLNIKVTEDLPSAMTEALIAMLAFRRLNRLGEEGCSAVCSALAGNAILECLSLSANAAGPQVRSSTSSH